MKKILLFLSFLLMSIGVFGDEIIYTLTPMTGTNSAYNENCDIVIDDITWNLTGNSQIQPWRIGANSSTAMNKTRRVLYSKTPIIDEITKIEIIHSNTSNITIDSMIVIISKNSDFSVPENILNLRFVANDTIAVDKPNDKNWDNCYYKIIYVLSGTKSKVNYLEFVKAIFYNANTRLYTVKWVANNDTIYSEEVLRKRKVNTIPLLNATDYCADIFIGWTNMEYYDNSRPFILFNSVEQSPKITNNTTFYSVFANFVK